MKITFLNIFLSFLIFYLLFPIINIFISLFKMLRKLIFKSSQQNRQKEEIAYRCSEYEINIRIRAKSQLDSIH